MIRCFEKGDFGAVVKRCADWTEKASIGTWIVAFIQQNYTAETLEKAAYGTIILVIISLVLTILARRMQ